MNASYQTGSIHTDKMKLTVIDHYPQCARKNNEAEIERSLFEIFRKYSVGH